MTILASRAQLRASFIRWALFLVPAILLIGILPSALFGPQGNPWFDALVKPGIYPPPYLFGIVWPILFILIGLALAVVVTARGAKGRELAIGVFLFHFLFNIAWTPVFFGMHQITGGLIVIAIALVTLLVATVLFWRVRMLAGLLLLPYVAWLCFATALNYQFLQLNPGVDGLDGPSSTVERMEI